MRAMADAGEPPPNLCPLCGHPTSATSPSGSASPPSAAAAAARQQPLMMMRKPPPEAPPAVVRVEIGDEAAALREALARQQAALGELQAELDAERGAAAGAASEAMTMILRLQREKAEAMMEARQFRRYAEEKMSHDAAELASLEEAIAKRDATAAATAMRGVPSQSRLGGGTPRCGLSIPASPRVSSTPRHASSTPSSSVAAAAAAAASGGYYPALRCFNDMQQHPPTASEADALDVQTPRDHLARLSHRVNMLERRAVAAPQPSITTPIIRVAPGSAFQQRNPRAFSDADSLDLCDGEFFPDDVDCGASDRVYTVDAIHGRGGGVPMAVPEGSYCGGTPVGSVSDCCGGGAPWGEDEEMRRLSARLRALEADRENMRQAILSMGAEKAQVVLLKEIAQQLCKDGPPTSSLPTVTVGQHYYKGAAPAPAMTVTVPRPQRPMVMHRMELKSQPKTSLFATVVKWVASIVWWRRKSARIKHPIGQCGNNVGLLLLLDKPFKAAGNGRQKPPKRV